MLHPMLHLVAQSVATTDGRNEHWPSTYWLVLGIPLAFVLGKLYLRSTSPQIRETPFFRESLDMYGVAVVFELLTEPAFAVVQHKMLYKTRAMVESAATLVSRRPSEKKRASRSAFARLASSRVYSVLRANGKNYSGAAEGIR